MVTETTSGAPNQQRLFTGSQKKRVLTQGGMRRRIDRGGMMTMEQEGVGPG